MVTMHNLAMVRCHYQEFLKETLNGDYWNDHFYYRETSYLIEAKLNYRTWSQVMAVLFLKVCDLKLGNIVQHSLEIRKQQIN